MKIYEVAEFEDTEFRIFEKGFRWHTLAYGFSFPHDEAKSAFWRAVNRLRKGYSGQLTRPHLLQTYAAWKAIYAEMESRIAEYRKQAKIFSQQKIAPPPEGQVALIADPAQFAKDQAQNLESGLEDVADVCNVLKDGIKALKDPPSDDEEFEDSEAYLNHPINRTFIRR